MESCKVEYKWRPELWNHVKFIQMEARAMESRKIAKKRKPRLWNHVKLHANGGQSYGIT